MIHLNSGYYNFARLRIRDKTPPPVHRYNGSRYSKRRLEQMKMIVADTSAGNNNIFLRDHDQCIMVEILLKVHLQ